ncbi:NAD(P)/FAD-dependent oxidoreductase [Patescibacteria group bacterium]
MTKNDDLVKHDVVIVGGGAAGLTAALFSARRGLRTLVVSQDIGGQAATTDEIENYPGVEFIDGPTLMKRVRSQSEDFGAEYFFDQVTNVKSTIPGGDVVPIFTTIGKTKTWKSYAVILAYGLTRRHLGVPGEEELYGKGVVYTASEEAHKFRDKTVAVIGGGNSAAQATLLLAEICPKVYLIHRRNEFSAEKILLERMKKHNNIEKILTCEVEKIDGQDTVESITIIGCDDPNDKKEIKVDGIFIEVGFTVKKDIVSSDVKVNARGNIIISQDNETSLPGLFAAGDVTSINYKQIIVSAGEGAKAAMTAQKYLQTNGLVKGTTIDWGRANKNKK